MPRRKWSRNRDRKMGREEKSLPLSSVELNTNRVKEQ